MTNFRLNMVALLSLVVSACGGGPDTTTATRAGELARQIRANPAEGPALIAAAGWTVAEYEALLYEVAADPAASAAYEAAYR
jgi:hypothetical protein